MSVQGQGPPDRISDPAESERPQAELFDFILSQAGPGTVRRKLRSNVSLKFPVSYLYSCTEATLGVKFREQCLGDGLMLS